MSRRFLFELLDQGTNLLWPTQKAQELLFDLGERKSYEEEARVEAIEECVSWWEGIGVAPDELIPCEPLSWPSIRPSLRLSDEETTPGVAKGLGKLAALVGVAPKTLANNLSKSRWYQCERPEHRWVLFLGRSLEADTFPKGFLFHRRSITSLHRALARSYGHLQIEQLDAADALLLFNLISFWQRRRPTQEVRSNRDQSKPRSHTPKPIVGLAGALLEQGLFERNLNYLVERKATWSLRLLFEFALTETHLGPHSQRAISFDEPASSLTSCWLKIIEEALRSRDVRELLGEESEHFRYRVDVMKAYREDRPPSAPPDSIAEHPYVASVWCLSQRYWAKRNGDDTSKFLLSLRRFREGDWEGKAMQIQQIQSKLERAST